jgi:aarF domain-containing kinase
MKGIFVSLSLTYPKPNQTPPPRPKHPQDGTLFRAFIMTELVKSIDALSREQLALLVASVGLSAARIPVLLPGAAVGSLPLAPQVSDEDRKVVENMVKIVEFLTKGGSISAGKDGSFIENMNVNPAAITAAGVDVATELLPYLPAVAREVLPELGRQLVSRISARFVREVFVPAGAGAAARR